jgi:RHH-type proline utilization regulon transcriptional repressor/proline dehydrogenase/delta 1-pyrroline-5-carboxylate dehydrogenase
LQGRLPELVALIVREGGRTPADAVSEVREAIDFCRYYAAQAREKFSQPIPLPGPTGERNSLSLHGRGVFVCISPWNFPLAIFVGQIAAALAAGNTVVAKPAEQTPLVAALAVELLHHAGIPGGALAFLPGDGRIGAALVAARECAGVAFTGSTEVARLIAQALAGKEGPLVPLIAETGGQNTLIADSSALPEQIVRDVVASAFNSAGQRCSALRVLFHPDRHRRPGVRNARRCDAGAAHWRPGRPAHRRRPGHRRGGTRRAAGACALARQFCHADLHLPARRGSDPPRHLLCAARL